VTPDTKDQEIRENLEGANKGKGSKKKRSIQKNAQDGVKAVTTIRGSQREQKDPPAEGNGGISQRRNLMTEN